MARWYRQRRKFFGGLAAVILAWGPTAQVDGFQARDWWALAAAVGAAVFGVHEAANDEAPKAWQPAVKVVDDAGQGQVVSLVAIVVLLLILLRVFHLI
jgi:hypothetical protein